MSQGYLLDTNIISETRKTHPHKAVIEFLTAADDSSLFLSVLTLGELHKGVELKRHTDPVGADKLAIWVANIEETFSDRVLPIGLTVAQIWGQLSAKRSLPVVDTLVAATAKVHNLMLVTRNSGDFKATGVPLIDPWLAR